MIKTLKIVVQVIWVVALVTCGSAVGGIYGWEHHGWLGAIVLGTIGFGVGAFVAGSPALFLQAMH